MMLINVQMTQFKTQLAELMLNHFNKFCIDDATFTHVKVALSMQNLS